MKITPNMLHIWLMTGLTIFGTPLAHGQDDLPELPGYINQSVINANALSGVRGRFAVNMVAGDSNLQANSAALALGGQGGMAVGLVGGVQVIDLRQPDLPDVSISLIGDHAFANSSGMISVNQTSGAGNAQANGAALALGYQEVVAESVLSATTSNAGLTDSRTDKSHQAASIHDTAFSGARGLVQVNQSAGSGNSTANNFALQVQFGAKP